MNEAVLIMLGQILENQAAILCALMGNEKSEVMRAIIERNVNETEAVMAALKVILHGEPETEEKKDE